MLVVYLLVSLYAFTSLTRKLSILILKASCVMYCNHICYFVAKWHDSSCNSKTIQKKTTNVFCANFTGRGFKDFIKSLKTKVRLSKTCLSKNFNTSHTHCLSGDWQGFISYFQKVFKKWRWLWCSLWLQKKSLWTFKTYSFSFLEAKDY